MIPYVKMLAVALSTLCACGEQVGSKMEKEQPFHFQLHSMQTNVKHVLQLCMQKFNI